MAPGGVISTLNTMHSLRAAFTPPVALAPTPLLQELRASGFVCGVDRGQLHQRVSSRKPHARRARPPQCALFDFVKKAGDYVKERAARDIATVEKFNQGLAKSRDALARDLTEVIGGLGEAIAAGELENVLEDLEAVLITADMGVDVVDKVLGDLRQEAKRGGIEKGSDVKALLKGSLTRILEEGCGEFVALEGGETDVVPQLSKAEEGPTVIMVIGANGMGKTTTIGKLATRLERGGASVLVAAGDTFRAGAVDQLAEWVSRAGVDFIAPKPGVKSPASVCFDAMEKAASRAKGESGAYDYVIIDTSGRLHNNANLMGELQKMVRVVKKFVPDAPHETLLVVDASIGRNAVAQAETWQREVGVTGLTVTKLDGTARAGFVVSVVDELQIPVKFIGVGETVDDLRDFDPKLFVNSLVGEE